ncbi:MAG: sigma-70 family RNA polymerase sigma factor [Bacilli bacterium]|nr:sigma-70 family RNA polymerase sigma factor [Bacilli bacterium]
MQIEKLIEENQKLIYKIASSFYNVDKDDLYQAGVLGLLKAIKKYKRGSNAKFSSYAYEYIYGEMYALVNNRNIKISKDILKLYKMIEKTRYALCQKNGYIPSDGQIADFLEIDEKKINEAIMAGKEIMSLDVHELMPVYETIACEEKTSIDDQIILSEGLEKLSDDEKQIIKARYYEDMTQSEVAKKLAMTQVMVSRYEKKGLSKMQEYMRLY